MTVRGIATMMCVCLVAAACTRQDSVFSLRPKFSEVSDAPVSSLAGCIASRWSSATRHVTRTRTDGMIRLRARTMFDGVTIGVRLRASQGRTRVEYFERRHADSLYVRMVGACLRSEDSRRP